MPNRTWDAIDAEMERQGKAISGMRGMVSRADENRSYHSQKRIPQTAVATLTNKEKFGSKY